MDSPEQLRPVDPARAPQAGLILFGIALIVSFLMPVFEGQTHGFRHHGGGGPDVKPIMVNIELLKDSGVPGTVKFFAIYPVIAGVLVLILGAAVSGPARAIVLAILAVTPLLVFMADEDIRMGMDNMLDVPGMNEVGLIALAALGAWMALYAGCRAAVFRPNSLAAAVIAAVGAGLLAVSLFMPIEQPWGEEAISFLAPFKAIGFDEGPREFQRPVHIMGWTELLSMLCKLGAGLCAIVMVIRQRNNSGSGAAGFALLLLGIGIYLIGGTIAAVPGFEDVPGEFVLMVVSGVLKGLIWFGTLFLLLPVALTDLVVTLSPFKDGQPEPAFAAAGERSSERLQQLAQLRAQGLIDDADYERKKAEILREL